MSIQKHPVVRDIDGTLAVTDQDDNELFVQVGHVAQSSSNHHHYPNIPRDAESGSVGLVPEPACNVTLRASKWRYVTRDGLSLSSELCPHCQDPDKLSKDRQGDADRFECGLCGDLIKQYPGHLGDCSGT